METALQAWQGALREGGQAPRTVENYSQVLRALAKQGVDLLAPPEQVAKALTSVRTQLQAEWEARTRSRSSIRLTVSALRSFYRALVTLGHYPADPTVGLRSLGAGETLPRPLAQEEVDALFAHTDPTTLTGLVDRCMLWLYYHSLRNTEVCQLHLANVLVSRREQAITLRFAAKGQRERVVVLLPEASDELAHYILQRLDPAATDVVDPLGAVERLLAATPDRPLFPVRGRREANRRFAALRTRAGLGPHVTPHALRHTCATQLLDAGVDLRVVQEVLGHASLRQTQGYTAVLTGRKRHAMHHLHRPGTLAEVHRG